MLLKLQIKIIRKCNNIKWHNKITNLFKYENNVSKKDDILTLTISKSISYFESYLNIYTYMKNMWVY